jgi:pentatricopeptide repeat protein
MQRSGARPDVISYSLLIKAYGKARRESEALAVFEEMLDAEVMYEFPLINIFLFNNKWRSIFQTQCVAKAFFLLLIIL